MIEEEIFLKTIPNTKALLQYGFICINNIYIYNTTLFNDDFNVIIEVENQKVSGSVIDSFSEEEYTLFRLKSKKGSYASKVKEAYEELLLDIKQKCFIQSLFISEEGRRLNEWLLKTYEFDREEKSTIRYLYQHKVIMSIKVKEEKGIYHEYLTLAGNDYLLEGCNEEDIHQKIEEVYQELYENNNHYWFIPANSGWFDVEDYFDSQEIIQWTQSNHIEKNDLIYLYISKPYSCIMYECIVTHTVQIDQGYRALYVKKLQKYERDYYDVHYLKSEGFKSVRSTRHLPIELAHKLHKKIK